MKYKRSKYQPPPRENTQLEVNMQSEYTPSTMYQALMEKELLSQLKHDVWNAAENLILSLEREDAFEIINSLPEEPLPHSKEFLEHAYKIYKIPEIIKSKGREVLYNELMAEIKNFSQHRIKMRETKGWKEVNLQIRQAPKCRHEGKIVISRCCPTCKKIEHNNHSCSKCTTSEDLEMDLAAHEYDPTLVYFVKRVCQACKTWKIQNATSAAA